MILQSAWQKPFDFLGSKPIVVEPVEEHLTSDAGLLPIRQFDEQIGLTAEFAAALRDPRFGPFVDHTFSDAEVDGLNEAALRHCENWLEDTWTNVLMRRFEPNSCGLPNSTSKLIPTTVR